ncbi:amino acid ABC transporter permease (plasmid) [Arthrobacter sp. KN11-1C]|uniref:amino acid ABC transporter permease n=1 Tax=Arthrobacter sp. KN11-1C TaxID=3445774 RepID=UPI003FA12E08
MVEQQVEQVHVEQTYTVRNPVLWKRWVAAAAVLAVLVGLVAVFANARIQWAQIPAYLFDRRILVGLLFTIAYTVLSMAIGVGGGVVLAVMRLAGNPVLRAVAAGYIWFFRGTPVIVQLLLWFNIALVIPAITVGIPFTDYVSTINANDLVTPFSAALLGLGLHEAAYMAEIVRAGIISVDKGQTEAAKAIGMTPRQSMTKVILPQAMRIIIPPTGNQFIGMLKTTSLVVVIAGAEMMTVAQNIYSRNFLTFELLITVTVWYLVLTSISEWVLSWLERRFSNSSPSGRKRKLKDRQEIRKLTLESETQA